MSSYEFNNTAHVTDIRDVIKRFEELDDMRQPRYVAGWNMPGYLPDSEPAEFDDADDALEYIKDAAKETIEDIVTGADVDDAMAKLADADAQESEIDAWEADKLGEFGQTFGNYHYWISQEGFIGLDEEETEEHAQLEKLLEELQGYGGDEQWRGDWYPVTLIRDSYFTDYVQEMLEDCGDLPRDLPSYIEIDWEATARNIRVDYSSVEIDGVTYWYR